jgi:Uma2 family endonuclease
MSATAPARMTADEFIAWAMEQPEGEHYELVAGEVVSMAPERPHTHAPRAASMNAWCKRSVRPISRARPIPMA